MKYLLLLFIFFPLSAMAFSNDQRLPTENQEQRAENLFKEIRCLVCTGESIAESNADLAHDLRVMIRGRIANGETDRQIIDYVSSRYGDQVLLKPPFALSTLLLWVLPFIFIAGGIYLIFFRERGE